MEQEENQYTSHLSNFYKPKKSKKQAKFSLNSIHRCNDENLHPTKKVRHIPFHRLDETIKTPSSIKTFIIPEIKCFMVSTTIRKTNVLSKKMMIEAQKKLKTITEEQNKKINLMPVYDLLDVIEEKVSDSSILIQKLEGCLKEFYPPSLKIMILYSGIFLCSVNSLHSKADNLSQTMYNEIILMNIPQYFMVYLMIRSRIKSSLLEWKEVLKILSKLLVFSWAFKEKDLEIWCYFQFSKVYFSMEEQETAQYFKKKSQRGELQPETSAFRVISERQLEFQLEEVKSKGKNFNFSHIIYQNRLKQVPKEIITFKEMVDDQRKLQSSIKKINKECGIKYVDNMLSRLTLCNFYKFSKSSGRNLKLQFGDHSYRTHQSFLKNINMFFRVKRNVQCPQITPLYTIQNSTKNWAILKQMMKIILIEANFLKHQMEIDDQ